MRWLASERLTVQRDRARNCAPRRRSPDPAAARLSDTIDPDAPFLELLGRHGEIIAPSAPGFGHSPRPKDFDTVYDLVHLYLEPWTRCRATR